MNLNENFGRALKNDEVLCRMENDTSGEKLVCLKNLNIKIGWWWLVDCGMQGTTRTDRLRMRIVTTIYITLIASSEIKEEQNLQTFLNGFSHINQHYTSGKKRVGE